MAEENRTVLVGLFEEPEVSLESTKEKQKKQCGHFLISWSISGIGCADCANDVVIQTNY